MTRPPPKMLFLLPNLFTVSSIFCGLYAIVESMGAAPDRFYRAAVAILFAVVFDSLDGRVARITKTQSDMGIQLDSLADLISFGVAPAVLYWQWALQGFGWIGLALIFVYVTCGALRLARFNVLATSARGPANHFMGLPIPLAAAALASLVLLHHRLGGGGLADQPLVLAVVGLLALLMVSNVPYRSFKKLRIDRTTLALLAVVLAALVFAILMTSFALMLVVVIGGMVALGMAEGLYRLVRRRRSPTAVPDDDEDAPEGEGESAV